MAEVGVALIGDEIGRKPAGLLLVFPVKFRLGLNLTSARKILEWMILECPNFPNRVGKRNLIEPILYWPNAHKFCLLV